MAEGDANLSDLFGWNERVTTLINHLLVSLMLACLTFSIIQLAENLFPGWEGSYLVWVCFFVALEAMYARRGVMQRRISFPEGEWFLFRLTEIVFILVVLKIILYVRGGDLRQILVDLPTWEQNFLGNFFTDEYIFALIVAFLIWGLASVFAEELEKLEGDEKVLALELESGISMERPAVRRQLASLVMMIGGLMAIVAAFLRMDWQSIWGEVPAFRADVYNILIYFILALILLSLTQFSILRVYWGLERIPISRKLAGGWVIYSLLFLLGVGILAVILPTQYSLGFWDVFGVILGVFVMVLNLLMVIILTPLFLLLGLLASLLGRPVPNMPTAAEPPLQILDSPTHNPELTWLDLLKSLAFWLTFAFVIIYSIHMYLDRNRDLLQRLRGLPVVQGALDVLRKFRAWLQGVKRGISATVAAQSRRWRVRWVAQRDRRPKQLFRLRRLSPRQRVLFFFQAMVRRGAEHGILRRPSQTPLEYSETLRPHLPEVEAEVQDLTDRFVEARYSPHEIDESYAGTVKRYWERVRKALRRAFQP